MENCFTTLESDILFNDLSKGLTVSVGTSVSAYLPNLPTMPDMPEDNVDVTDFERSCEKDIHFRLPAKQGSSCCASSKMKTRKSKCEHVCTSVNDIENLTEQFRCGACNKKFLNICGLHEHFKVFHKTVGSYHYDDILKTAFPKFESFCRYTQTEEESFLRDPDCDATQDIGTSTAVVSRVDGLKNEHYDSETDNDFSTLLDLDSCNSSTTIEYASLSKYDDSTLEERVESSLKSSLKRKGAEEKRELKKRIKLETSNEPLTVCSKNDESNQIRTKETNNSADIDTPTSPNQCQGPKLVCEICNASFKCNSSLVRHETTKHQSELKYACDDCGRKFMRERDLQRHQTYAHSSTKVKKEIINSPCSVSSDDTVTSKFDELERLASPVTDTETTHEKARPKTGRKQRSKKESMLQKTPYTCEICGYIMPRSKMEIHKRIHTGERPYECTVCGKGLISAEKLRRHMLTHDTVKKHTCDICGVGFQMKFKLKMHMHIHTGKKPYLCSICGAEFNHSSNLANHTRCVHRQVKPYKCEICGSTFARRSQLDDHEYSHSTEKQFQCRFCGKSFKYLKGMRRHERNHMENKSDYPCDKCDLKFNRKDTLERHQQVHEKEITYQCHVCEETLSDRKELTEHIKTHIEKTVYECILCNETFSVAHNYYTHMLVSHEMSKEMATLMHTEKKDKQVVKRLTKNAKVLDPNLPLPVEQVVPASTEPIVTSATSSTFNVNQIVSNMLEDNNKATLNAMTRVATENLCLHSQDIHEVEKVTTLLPPVNPLSVSRLLPIDLGHDVGFELGKKPNLNMVSGPIPMSDNTFGHGVNSIVNHLGLTQDNSMVNNNTIAQLPVSDVLSFTNPVTVPDMSCFSSFMCQPSHTHLPPLSLIGNPSIGNQTMVNQSVGTQAIGNQSLMNQSIGNQSLQNQSLGNQSLQNQPLGNQPIGNQSLQNQSLNPPLPTLTTQPDMHSLEQGAIESLRRLQEAAEPTVSSAIEALLIASRPQPGILVAGNLNNLTDTTTANDNTGAGFRIQSLF